MSTSTPTAQTYGLQQDIGESSTSRVSGPVSASEEMTPESISTLQTANNHPNGIPSYDGVMGQILGVLQIIAQNTSAINQIPDAMSRVKINVNGSGGASVDSSGANINNSNATSNFFTGGKAPVSGYKATPSNALLVASGI